MSGNALAFKRSSVSDVHGLCASPMGAVEGRKLPIIHGFTFAGDGYHSNVNVDTNFSAALLCELGHVFGDVYRRVLYLCQRHGVVSRSIVGCIDTKDSFH